MRLRIALLAFMMVPGAAAHATQDTTWLLVISGVGGDPEHRQSFVQMSLELIDAATERYGLPAERTTYLAERTELASGRADDRSTRDNVEGAIQAIGVKAAAGEQVIIVLIGHGTSQGMDARFSLPGPDMAPADFAALLDLLSDQRVAFINTASASGGFVAALSGPGRAIVTATRGPQQREETLFPRYFVEAFASGGADLDKDDRISILEAFRYATTQVERAYEADGRLRTEHALLDDNGDGEGSMRPDRSTSDGRLAGTLGLGGPTATSQGAPSEAGGDPELRALLLQRGELQAELDALRARKDELEEDHYFELLEELLVQIAQLDAAIRARGGSQP